MKILVFSAGIKSSAKGHDETSCEPALMQKGTATRVTGLTYMKTKCYKEAKELSYSSLKAAV